MMRSVRLWLVAACSLLFLLLQPGSSARSETCFFLDFDDDGDPWTLRTQLPEGQTTATARFVFQAPSVLPSGEEFFWTVVEGCCDDMFEWGHYGARWRFETLQFDTRYVSYFEAVLPTCVDCCAWVIQGIFADPMAVVPGQRYFIGGGEVDAFCEDFPPPCYPPQDFYINFSPAGGCAAGSSELMQFTCPQSGIPAEEPPARTVRWGRIKTLYR